MRGISFIAARIFIIAGLSMLFFLVSCSEKEVVFEAAPFTMNTELIGEPVDVPELNLQISPPIGWAKLDSLLLDNFRKMLGGTDLAREFYPLFPIVVFMDSATGSMMYIAQIEESEAGMTQIAEHYDDFLSPRMASSAMTSAHYAVNDVKIFYYLLHSTEVVNYKLIGETAQDKRFLIEFIIGGVVYAQIEPSISASLATLKLASVAPK